MEPSRKHIVLYDGVCGLCNHSVKFILRRDPDGVFGFAAQQSEFAAKAMAKHNRTPDLDGLYVLANYDTPGELLLSRAAGVFFILKRIRTPLRVFWIFALLPNFILDFGYGLIARMRYRLWGKHDTCPIPTKEDRARYVELQ